MGECGPQTKKAPPGVHPNGARFKGDSRWIPLNPLYRLQSPLDFIEVVAQIRFVAAKEKLFVANLRPASPLFVRVANMVWILNNAERIEG